MKTPRSIILSSALLILALMLVSCASEYDTTTTRTPLPPPEPTMGGFSPFGWSPRGFGAQNEPYNPLTSPPCPASPTRFRTCGTGRGGPGLAPKSESRQSDVNNTD